MPGSSSDAWSHGGLLYPVCSQWASRWIVPDDESHGASVGDPCPRIGSGERVMRTLGPGHRVQVSEGHGISNAGFDIPNGVLICMVAK